tara:strand:+ start:1007 stop:1747 length:741 start_codon:yes stop_codon:yes gene_type:complete
MSKCSTISKETIQRLIRDVKQLIKEPLHDNGIYYEHDQEDMLKGYAMIVGPSDTPYFGGYYFFEFTYPNNYPHSPPSVLYQTNGDQIRFNPNLYKNGKVCISLLNTWKGDQWTSCQSISTILLALCTLLCDKPLLNEPGIMEKHKDFNKYNSIIKFKNLEIACLHLINKKEGYYLEKFEKFYTTMINHFKTNCKQIEEVLSCMKENCETMSETVQTSLYSMRVTMNYVKLYKYFHETKQKFIGEMI